MKISSFRKALLGLVLATAVTGWSAGSSDAATLSFHVDLNPASLVGNPAGPFSLDLQLGKGNGLSNSVSFGNFTFLGGAPTGTGTTTGGASGSLGSTVFLSDVSTINEYYQTFSGTVALIGFDVTTTLNPSAGVPDLLTVSILDNALNPILTNSPGVGTSAETDYLVGLQIGDRATFASVASYTSNVVGSTTPGVIARVTSVPEPASFVWIALAIASGIWSSQRRASGRV